MQSCPSSHPFQTQLEGLSFQPVTSLSSPRASHLSSFPSLLHTRHKPRAFLFKALLFSLSSHLSFSTQSSTPIPKLPKSSPKHQHQLLHFLPLSLFPWGECSLLISTSPPYKPPHLQDSQVVLKGNVLLQSLMWTGLDSLLFETHPSPSRRFTFHHSSCIALKYYLYRERWRFWSVTVQHPAQGGLT